MPDHPFRDLSVILTGASAGIGRAMSLQLAAQGARLTLAARDAGRLEAVARECRTLGARAIPVVTDVADEDACRRLVDAAIEEFGAVDVLVNNAGLSMWARFAEVTDLAPFEQMMRVNYLGSVYCTHAALPHLLRTRGRIVAVSSLTGRTGVPTRSGYAATKHAMAGFFDSLRIELEGSGVSVTVVYPGFVSRTARCARGR
jgi:NADP-dependent 3-hydroxy acid dehydrogenase YdfG